MYDGVLLLTQQYFNGTHDFGRLPILGAYNFARQAALAINQISFRKHRGSIIGGALLARVTISREDHVIIREEFFVSCLIFVHAHSENYAASRRNSLLEAIERLGFFEARRAPRRPKIQD